MYQFWVRIHPAVQVGASGEADVSWPVSFEQAAERLAQLDRLFIEPDGSFVWRGDEAGQPWQVDGVVYDRVGGLSHVELKGSCPAAALESILSAIRAPSVALTFEHIGDGTMIDEAAFRRTAQRKATS